MLKRLTIVLLILSLLACFLPAQAASGTLRRGSRGSEVTRLQNALKELGFYSMTVDGIYGRGTLAAVKAYQRANGLKADGIAGPKTMAKLYGSAGREAYANMTSRVTDILGQVLAVPAEGVYVEYEETEHWGWNGSNF